VVIQQNSRKLLMVDILMSETFWAHKQWNKIANDIKLVFYSSTITMMHGPINIRFANMTCFEPLVHHRRSFWAFCSTCSLALALHDPVTSWCSVYQVEIRSAKSHIGSSQPVPKFNLFQQQNTGRGTVNNISYWRWLRVTWTLKF